MRTGRLLSILAVLALMGLAPVAGVTSTAHAATSCPSSESDLQNLMSAGGAVYLSCSNPTTISFTSHIAVSNSVTLDASGSPQPITFDGGGSTDLFNVGVRAELTLSNLTLTNGYSPGGGAIENAGTVNILDSTLGHNPGTAVINTGTLFITRSTVTANAGGGIDNACCESGSGNLTITDSTFSNNSNPYGLGGAVENELGGDVTVTNSTFYRNSAESGGGIWVATGATTTINNSTFVGNSVPTYSPYGSAIAVANEGAATIAGTIIADNTGAQNCDIQPSGRIIDGSYNLTDGNGNCGLTGSTDLTTTDPQLDPTGLQSNGAHVIFPQTVALEPGSPAIDAIPTGQAGCPGKDERGLGRPDGSESACDIGAYESGNVGPTQVCPSGCTYSQIQPALDAAYNGDTISVAPGTYSGGLSIRKSVSLVGAGAGSVTIQGGDSVVYINSGVTARIQGVTITGGNATYYGGGIMNQGALTLDSSTVSGNTTSARISYSGGGGIANIGALTVTNSTISGNSAQVGGGIYTEAGTTMTLANSTISGNSAYQQGGLYAEGAITLSGTILAKNTTSTSGPDCSGRLTDGSGGHNLLGDNSDCTGLTDGVNGDQVGTDATPIDPKLGPLRDNGGPTQTQAVLPGSPAIDAIPTSSGTCPATDQRGVSRPDDSEGFCDIGAYESTYTLAATSLSAVSGSGTYSGTATLTATLTAGATPVGGETITFTLNGAAVCGGSGQPTCPTTDNNGVATLQKVSLAGITAGSYATAVGASFAGDTGYSASTAAGTLTISNPAPATSGLTPAAVQAGGAAFPLTVSGARFVPGSTVQLTAADGTSTTLTPSAVASDGTQLTVTVPATLTARAGTLRVTVVNAAPGGGTSTLQPLFVTAASTAVASVSASTGGTASTGGSGPTTAGSVTLSGAGGSGTLAVAVYSANPGSAPSFAASGAYFDAYVAPGSTYSGAQIVDCALQGGSQADWYNAATGAWVAASNQSYNPTTQCTTITVNASSTPNLTQLGGTPFAIAHVPPVVAVPGAQSVSYGSRLSVTVAASEVEPSDVVTLTASGLPAGLRLGPTTFNQASGQWTATVSGTVTGSAGPYTATVTATNGFSASKAQSVSIAVTPAPLTITANDQTTPYGHVPADTWTSTGWVNGETANTLASAPNSPPTCGASVAGSPAAATTPPGIYAGAITCAGAVDPNYTISYVPGTLTIDPLLSLDEQGLPGSVAHQAMLDGKTVDLPDANVELAYGSSHSYSFPALVIDGSSGTVYVTGDPGFSGTVTANLSDTAVYQTMAQIVSAALSAGGIDNGGQATALTQQFAAVQADIQAGNTGQALADLHTFAAHVRAQAGKHITAATAKALLADAQLVYTRLGGTGTV